MAVSHHPDRSGMEMMLLMKILGGTIPHTDRKEIHIQEDLQVPIGIRGLRGFSLLGLCSHGLWLHLSAIIANSKPELFTD